MTKSYIEDEAVEQIDDLSVHVLDALRKRGLKDSEFDDIRCNYLFEGNYRVNCYKDNKIPESFYIKFSKDEGIIRMWPNLGE